MNTTIITQIFRENGSKTVIPIPESNGLPAKNDYDPYMHRNIQHPTT